MNFGVEVKKLVPRAIFGINGKVNLGLHLHPNKKEMLFPLGNKIGIADVDTNRQEFIGGHTNTISCLDLSKSGKYIGSGQINHMGFQGYVILWDYNTRKELARHDLHKVRVQSVCFTAEDKYLVSIGGLDDGSVIVFDIETCTPICRSVASRSISGCGVVLRGLKNNPSFFVSAGDHHLRIWSILREQKKLQVSDINVGKQQRLYLTLRIDKRDENAYLGTGTGDIIKVCLNCCDREMVTIKGFPAVALGAFGTHNPRKPYGKDCNRYVNGVRQLYIVDDGVLLVGAGDGTIELVEERKDVNIAQFRDYPNPTWPMLRMLKRTQVSGTVTSIVHVNDHSFYICTKTNEIYMLNIKNFALKLLKTCHQKSVYDIVFPKKLSSVFATSGHECIRIWSTKRLQELLRIMVYNFECASIIFTHDGTSIISAWNDGVIRAFTPITGRLIYAIPNAHNKGCSALTVSSTGRTLVTGGIEGQVRVWKIEPYRQSLLGVLKDHSGPISSLDFNHLDTEVISACSDGSCVIWDVNRFSRKQVVTANTQFMAARYFPTGVQVLTCGSDGRISYWMVFNGSLIRELMASKKSSVNSVAINTTGDYFVTVGSDQMVKLWDYNRGLVVCQGSEHASSAISAAYSPCGKFVVTGSTDGSIIIWDIPSEFWGKTNPPESEQQAKDVLQKSKLTGSKSKIYTGARTATQVENIDGLVAKTSKGDICCVECPPIDMKKQPVVSENCNFMNPNEKPKKTMATENCKFTHPITKCK